METTTRDYRLVRRVDLAFEEADRKVREELEKEGFGVLTEIDVQETLQRKLGTDFRPYRILGACNPPLAHRALSEEVDIGLLLPCNVIVYAGDQEGTSLVAAIDPVAQLGLTHREDLEPLAREVEERLRRVLDSV